jgi:hypothetical protein
MSWSRWNIEARPRRAVSSDISDREEAAVADQTKQSEKPRFAIFRGKDARNEADTPFIWFKSGFPLPRHRHNLVEA